MKKKKIKEVVRKMYTKELKRRCKEKLNYLSKYGYNIPDKMKLKIDLDSGFFMGFKNETSCKHYIGRASKEEGNILVLGINGSCKSFVIGKSTVRSWRDQMIVFDPKGELAEYYSGLVKRRIVKRRYIVFDPKRGKKHYDPYALIRMDPEHAIQYIRDISHSLIEKPVNISDSYWIDAARSLLCAIISYCISRNMNFTDTVVFACSNSIDEISGKIKISDCDDAKMLLKDLKDASKKQKSAIYQEMKEKILLFATDNDIKEILSVGYGEDSFSWDELEDLTEEERPNVFLRFDPELLEQWGGLARLILSQLVAQLHRRAEKWVDGVNKVQPLLIMLDEFPLFGHMEIISSAMTTLRSKGVTFCFMIQSIPQLDEKYGSNVRKIIMDNCQYKIILKITEPESQKYLSELFGTEPTALISGSITASNEKKDMGFGFQISETREPLIYPEEFAQNEDILLNITGNSYRTHKIALEKRLTQEQDVGYRVYEKPFLKKR